MNARAIAGLLNRSDQHAGADRIGLMLNLRRFGGKVHARLTYALDFRERALHPTHAGRAGHSTDVKARAGVVGSDRLWIRSHVGQFTGRRAQTRASGRFACIALT